jgi:ribonuclease P protein component
LVNNVNTRPALPRFTFKKFERLSSKKDIQELFENGSSFFLFPFKVLYAVHLSEHQKSHQILISVPKKIHKSAVARNNIKRKIREAYRLNKHLLKTDSGDFLSIAYLYVGKEDLPFSKIQSKLIESIYRLNKEYK